MNVKSLSLALALVLAFPANAQVLAPEPAAPVTWNHDPAAALGPSVWGTLTFEFATCGSVLAARCSASPDPLGPLTQVGRKQSPIDIVTRSAIAASLPSLAFQYGQTPFVIENTGHVVEVPYAPGAGALRVGQDSYDLLQLHFHTLSEHTVDGQLADMEVHLVHRNVVGDLAVVGALLRVGPNPNPLVERIFAHAPLREGAVELEGTLSASSLLPASASISYWTYSGSLTTPPCTEGVRWLVVKEPVFVSAATLARFRQIVSLFPEYGGYDQNNRPVRPANGRNVLGR